MDEYVTFLEADDEVSRPSRARRLALIVGEFGEARGMLFPGGVVAMTAFEEARRSYVCGLYIATVLLAQTSLEHMLAGLLHISGRDGRWGFAEILDLAKAERLVSPEESELFNRLRTLRNPYVHARLPGAAGSLAARAIDGVQDLELMEEDATLAITALLRLVRRRPFTPDA